MIIETWSPEETFALGKKIGEKAQPGQIYTLTGDLGVGKTVFTQGVADGLEITEAISSPTFTIVQIYENGRLPFYHFDVYRIADVNEDGTFKEISEKRSLCHFSSHRNRTIKSCSYCTDFARWKFLVTKR